MPDRIAPGVRLLLCGINPGRHSFEQGHHYAGPGNRFWPALHAAGITPGLWAPERDVELPTLGVGLTNLASRWTRAAAELEAAELQRGGQRLLGRVAELEPRVVAVLGVGAFRIAFARPAAQAGDRLDARELVGDATLDLRPGAEVHVLPNPSGLNAHFPLAEQARLLRRAALAAGLSLQPPRGGRL
ncbi:MAG: mismatch-specific DNA-glycosylase [Acidobacteria bacterium]|nr:MAG: mismatch-specific DNA-glycosylase [Acidobacteriota bacterium]REK04420.1 MAG: mismatch-specific DNA-glycosylase [Acidobacteriota bacterium]